MQESPRNPAQKTNDWPSNSKGYKLVTAIGKGYFGIVWKAEVLDGVHKGKNVALKKIDLEKCPTTKIDEIRKNVLLLNLLDHPNLLNNKTAFIHGKELWIIAEIMAGGSVDKIIQSSFPNGLKDQALIVTILKETLEGLKYLHQNNQVHRDIKAANILIGMDGSVKISDFGVAARLKEGKKRNTFIGSPCWMAPEVFEQDRKGGYDSKADLWSLGITALELANGKPPNYELTTMKLILKTINEDPPELSTEPYWDTNFREFLSYCLVKDPNKRKSADDLLKSCKSFFNKAKGKDYIKEKLLKNIVPLESRVDAQTLEMARAEIEGKKLNKSNTLEFSFHCDENEDDNDSSNVFDSYKVQIASKAHLPRVESDLRIGRSLTNFVGNEYDKEPHSADYVKRENFKNTKSQPSSFAHRQKAEKLINCKGDIKDFNFLGEDET